MPQSSHQTQFTPLSSKQPSQTYSNTPTSNPIVTCLPHSTPRSLFSSSAPLVSLFYHRAPPSCAHVTIGYVGGTFLSRLLTTPSIVDKLDLTLYVRSPEKARSLESEFGVKTVVGTLADVDKLENASEQAHLVISIVSAAILETSWCKF